MRKTLLLLLMTLCLFLLQPALADGDRDDLLQGRWARGMAVYEDKLYALVPDDAGQVILEVTPGTEPRPFLSLGADDDITDLLADEKMLYGFNRETGRVCTLTAQGAHWRPQAVDAAPFTRMPHSPNAPFLFEGTLYTPLTNITTAEAFPPLALAQSDLQSGETTLLKVPDAVSIVPYKPGQLLLMQVERKDNRSFWKLAAFDVKTGALAPLPIKMPEAFEYGSNIGALAYDPQGDRIFYADARQVMASAALAPFERVGLLNFDHLSFDSARGFVMGGMYAVESGGLSLRRTDRVVHIETLTILGHVAPDTVRLFRSERPDALPILQDGRITPQDVFLRTQSGDDSVDIYILPLNADFRALIEKGYALDLGADSQLKADANTLYPALQSAISDSKGSLRAVPVDLHSMSTYARGEHWREVFGGSAYPATWGELMDARLKFANSDRDDLIFFAFGDSPQVLKYLLQAYILRYEQPGEPLNFEHPALRHALTAYLSAKDLRLDVEQEDWASETGPDNHLIALYASAAQFYKADERSDFPILPPFVFEAGQAPMDMVRVNAAIINPLSHNQQLGMDFLKVLSRKEADPRRYYAIHPDDNAPYPYTSAELEERIAFMQRQRSQFEEQIKRIEAGEEVDADKEFLRGRLEQLQRDLADQERLKWMLSEEEIQNYRQTAQYMAVPDKSLLLSDQVWQQAQGLIERLYEGTLTVDAFFQEMNQMSSLVYHEMR